MLEAIQPFFLSFMIGLLIGIERERSQMQGVKAIGMRTFILFALLGTLAAKINVHSLTFSLSLFIFATLMLSYFRATRDKKKSSSIGITTEMAAATVFMLGYLMLWHMLLAVCIATAVLVILYGRRSLHSFAKEKITAQEIEASIIIIIISLGIISFLPNKTIDPWQLFNPQSFGFIILILASLQFGGYLGIRLFGERLGMLLNGFFGGLISSTGLFAMLSHAKRSKNQTVFSGVIAGIFATIATLLAFLIVIFVTAPTLLQIIIWPVLAAILFGGLSSWLCMQKQTDKKFNITYPNPLDIKALIKLALLIMGILIFVALIKQYIGQGALPLAAFIAGLFELHGVAYAVALLYSEGKLAVTEATQLLAIMVVASFISKFALVWVIAHNRFALIISLFLAGMLGTASLVYFFIFWSGYLSP